MPENSLYGFDQIHPSDRALVGDKAFYLALLAQRRYSVVPGFVISADKFQTFIEQIEWAEPMFADLPNSSLYLDVDNPRQLQEVAQHIRQAIQSTPLAESWLNQLEQTCQQWQPSALILRPSLALPVSVDPAISLRTTGLLEATVCPANRLAIARSLKRVWAELFRAKSLLYWQRLRVQLQHIRLAVLVQPIESVVASGTAQLHQNHASIRAVWGLGRGLMTGEVEPDTYTIDLSTGNSTHQPGLKTIAYELSSAAASSEPLNFYSSGSYQTRLLETPQQTQPVLIDRQIEALVQLIQQIAAELGTVLEIEWTLTSTEEPHFQITQVIPRLTDRLQNEISSTRSQNTLHFSPQTADPAPQSQSSTQSQSLTQSQSSTQFPQAPLIGVAAAPGQVVAPAWVMTDAVVPTDIPTGCILVASSITPDWLPWIKQAAGIVTEQGGVTSHGAVLAREMGIPAVTGIFQATQRLQTGIMLLVDGDRGEICQTEAIDSIHRSVYHSTNRATDRATNRATDHSFHHLINRSSNRNQPIDEIATQFYTTAYNIQAPATQLFVTLSQPNVLPRLTNLPIDGVGLLRSELMMLEILEQHHPQQWLDQGQTAELTQRIAERIQQFAAAFAPRPVFYRSSDLRSHEFRQLKGYQAPPELNPALGMRGTLNYQLNPGLFSVELAALRQVQQQYHNVHLILPFVRTVEEFIGCRQRIEQAGLKQAPHFQVWMMAEVPSVLLLLPDYIAAGVQGVAIGSNDLTQLLLGIDREQPSLSTAFNPRHPAVLRAIRQIIHTTKQANIPCSICGELTSQYPEVIESLVHWGITALSVDWNEIEPTYQAIVRAEQKLLLDAARHRLRES